MGILSMTLATATPCHCFQILIWLIQASNRSNWSFYTSRFPPSFTEGGCWPGVYLEKANLNLDLSRCFRIIVKLGGSDYTAVLQNDGNFDQIWTHMVLSKMFLPITYREGWLVSEQYFYALKNPGGSLKHILSNSKYRLGQMWLDPPLCNIPKPKRCLNSSNWQSTSSQVVAYDRSLG